MVCICPYIYFMPKNFFWLIKTVCKDDTNNDKEGQLNYETQEGNELNRPMRQPNAKYNIFY